MQHCRYFQWLKKWSSIGLLVVYLWSTCYLLVEYLLSISGLLGVYLYQKSTSGLLIVYLLSICCVLVVQQWSTSGLNTIRNVQKNTKTPETWENAHNLDKTLRKTWTVRPKKVLTEFWLKNTPAIYEQLSAVSWPSAIPNNISYMMYKY